MSQAGIAAGSIDSAAKKVSQWAGEWQVLEGRSATMLGNDRDITLDAIYGLYAAVQLELPEHVAFVPSPFAMRYGGGFAAALWFIRSQHQYKEIARRATAAAAADTSYIGKVVRALIPGAPAVSVIGPSGPKLTLPTGTRGVVSDRSWYYADMARARKWAKKVGGEEFQFFLNCAQEAWRMTQDGGATTEWATTNDRDATPAHKHWANASAHAGPRVVHDKFCVVSDRPLYLHTDEEGRPHCETGPYSEWSDGSRAYALHGFLVPWWVIERPELLTESVIAAENNPDLREIMRTRTRDAVTA